MQLPQTRRLTLRKQRPDLIKDKVANEAEKIVAAEGTTGFNKTALESLVAATSNTIQMQNDLIKVLLH